MEEFKEFLKSRRIALIISVIYVGLGTTAVCSVYGSDFLYGEWAGYVLLITFPVSFFSFMYRYAESDFLLPVFIIQFIVFLCTFFILSLFIKKKNHES
ncbi:hypothetical protein ACI513_19735 [Chryseobacterium sp. M5]|uniref:hypothetical protein n=1 Tax=Chryseobacterium sp. M5 TaxID=3379128 RepID=UPI003857DD3D